MVRARPQRPSPTPRSHAFPRLPGVAELGWSPASTHDWDTYKVRLAARAPYWEAAGIDYYRSPQVPWS
ncbi:hypothetical protein [Streptomyces sp. NPDC044948]|uniref:hypothetical protein n=1 Tax=Streptomyces sp. NPDC044948 TaxID=3157092 RepID=UPI0033FBA19B